MQFPLQCKEVCNIIMHGIKKKLYEGQRGLTHKLKIENGLKCPKINKGKCEISKNINHQQLLKHKIRLPVYTGNPKLVCGMYFLWIRPLWFSALHLACYNSRLSIINTSIRFIQAV